MNNTFTRFHRLLIWALSLGGSFAAQAGYTPVALTGFNADVVVDGANANPLTASSIGIDEGNYAFMSRSFNSTGTSYLPDNGIISSAATAGLTYQLNSYALNNSLRIPNTIPGQGAGTGTLMFDTPQTAGDVYVLATSGSAASTVTMIVNFTDGSNRTYSGLTVSDWYWGSNFAIQGLGRILRTGTNKENNASNPRLYQIRLPFNAADLNKQIQSVRFDKTSTVGVLNVMAITVNPACAASPTAGNAVASVSTACFSTSITLSLNGATSSTDLGISHQWQSSTDGGMSWGNISGATGATYTATGQTATTQYRALLSCSYSGQSEASAPVTVTQNNYLSCYCTPSSTGTNEYIRRVTLNTLDNNSNANNAGYAFFNSAANHTTTVSRGGVYPFGLTVRSNNINSRGGVWVDYNQNGTFEASEYTFVGTVPTAGTVDPASFTVSLTIPNTAALGQTRMRVRWRNQNFTGTAADACATGWFGEAEDYLITIAPSNDCTGTPPTLTATANGSASGTSVCSTGTLTLSASGVPAGVTGFSYQWQRSDAGANAFVNLGSAQTGPLLNTTQTVPSDYQLIVTCTPSGLSTTSTMVAVAQSSYLNCYCVASSNSGGEYINSVSVNTLSNVTNAGSTATNGYGDFTGAGNPTTNLVQGNSYPVTLGIRSNAPNSQAGIWVDYNHNGVFDASEFLNGGTSSAINTNVTLNSTLAVPNTALTGPTRLRVRWHNDVVNPGDACATGWNGETEDYLVTIVAPTPCSGTPPTTTASSTAAAVCQGTAFTLSATGTDPNASGLSYQWQRSDAGANAFTNLGSAQTMPGYAVASQTTATDYRVVVTCTASGQSATSSVISVAQNSFMTCYCQPSSSSLGEYFTNVRIGSINNTSGNSTTTTPAGYRDYTISPTAAQTTSLVRSSPYTISISAVNNRINSQALLWIDYDHSGTFDPSEYYLIGTGPSTGTTFPPANFSRTFTIPPTALLGPTHLRVRWHNDNNSTDPCALGWNGETEEYLVNIIDNNLVVSTTAPIPSGTYSNITITGTGTGTFSGPTAVTGTLAVQPGGTLVTACQPLTGSGTFALAAGATLNICDPQGISLSGATGAVQTATRQFSAAGTYIYSGSAAQETGSGLPAQVRNLTVNTSGGDLTLSQPVAIRRLLTLTSGSLLNGQNLTLRSDADSTALVSVGPAGGTVVGAATVQRYISPATNPGLGYRHLAAPVTNTTLADLTTASFSPLVNPAYNSSPRPNNVTPFPNIFSYSEARQATSPAVTYSVFDKGWLSPTAVSAPMESGKGYTVNLAAGQMVDFVGTLGTGTVNLPLTRGATAEAGWNFIGNPYPSTLNWDNVAIPTGMDAAVYVYRSTSQYGGSYSTYTNGLGNGSPTLAMGQAAFVRVSPGTTSTTLTLTDAARSADFSANADLQRGNDLRPRLQLSLTNAGATLTDAAYVYFEAGATRGVDARYDAVKLPNPSGLSLASVTAGTELAINGLPALSADVLPLTVAVPQAGTYTLRAAELLNLAGAPVYLHDALTGQQIDLSRQPAYSFSAAGAARLTGRFSLSFAPAAPLGVQAGLQAADLRLYPNPAHGSFTVLVPAVAGAKQVQLALFNSLGQRVRAQELPLSAAGLQATMDVRGLAAGIYTLRLAVPGQAPVARRIAVE